MLLLYPIEVVRGHSSPGQHKPGSEDFPLSPRIFTKRLQSHLRGIICCYYCIEVVRGHSSPGTSSVGKPGLPLIAKNLYEETTESTLMRYAAVNTVLK
jgi:hypothetical protein